MVLKVNNVLYSFSCCDDVQKYLRRFFGERKKLAFDLTTMWTLT
jgi:hypothetical protein